MANKKQEIDLIFETSWEVCNKIGGIYTVLSTKAKTMQLAGKDKVIFIGPDVWTADNPSPWFTEVRTPLSAWARQAQLPDGVAVRVGRWEVPGRPLAVLVKFDSLYATKNDFYARMWERFGVDSLHAYGDYDEGCAFARAAGMVIESILAWMGPKVKEVIAHFDEWTTGMGLLYVKSHMPEAATVFTTHATSIGRSICGNGKDLYEYFEGYDGDQMARELNMESKHSLEKAAAHNADCFTTVSEVTARECRQLLGKAPDVVTPNGFEPDFVPSKALYARRREAGRNRLLRVASLLAGHRLPDDTAIIVTSGRNEYRNKGLDLFLDSMRELAGKLPADRQALAIVAVPAWVKEPSGDLLVDLRDGGDVAPQPDFLTHRLFNEDSDAVACRIAQLEREGMPENLKLMYIPCYLDGHDGIIDISYYELMPAIDLTMFPSYYEPWGYTPLESIAFGVPTVTTDKAGFGQWVSDHFPDSLRESGVKVVKRDDTGYDAARDEIAATALEYIGAPEDVRMECRRAASATAKAADWQYFIKDYEDAFAVAFGHRDLRVGCIK